MYLILSFCTQQDHDVFECLLYHNSMSFYWMFDSPSNTIYSYPARFHYSGWDVTYTQNKWWLRNGGLQSSLLSCRLLSLIMIHKLWNHWNVNKLMLFFFKQYMLKRIYVTLNLWPTNKQYFRRSYIDALNPLWAF